MSEINLNLPSKLTPKQRIDMQLKGLSPLSPKDVKAYLSGAQLSLKEKSERIDRLVGASSNLGGGHEEEIDGVKIAGRVVDELDIEDMAPKELPRKKMLNEINNMSAGKVFGSDDLLSFKKPERQTVNVEEIREKGQVDAKNYLNDFVINLQENTIQTRMNLFKSLKKIMTTYSELQKQPMLLKVYNEGVVSTEKKMLENLSK